MTKPITVSDAELEKLMNDLDAMLEAQEQGVAPPQPPQPVAAPEPALEPVLTPAEPAQEDDKLNDEPFVKPEPEPETPVPAAPPVAPQPPTATPTAGLKYFVDVEAFKRQTDLDETNLDRSAMEQSGLRAYYGAQAAYAEGQAAQVKAKFEILEAKIYNEIRNKLAVGGEKVTEKMVENAVKLDPRWQAAKMAVIDAATIAEVNKGLTFALADRREMLIQLCSDRRKDFEGQLRIKQEADLATQARGAVRAALG